MCGISAILGNYKLSTIIKCLANLQNRGYDSAGLSYINNEDSNNCNFIIKKELNKESIDNLLKYTESINKYKTFNNCISHTRWATHGGITINNSHPHISNNGQFCLVHNGIIENYLQLKSFLKENEFIFYSDTDSEIIVNLIQYYYNKNSKDINESNEYLTNIFQDSIYLALKDCIGTWALVIQNIQKPDKLYAIKKR